MALIPYPDPETLSPEANALLARLPQNIARMFSGSGNLFKPLIDFAVEFMVRGKMSGKLRELVACRMGHRYDAKYVLDQHQLMARAEGVTDEELEAVAGRLPSPIFSEHDNAALLLTDALVESPRAPEALVLKAYELMGETAFHQLLLVIGFHHMSVRYTESLRIDLDASAKGNALNNALFTEAGATSPPT